MTIDLKFGTPVTNIAASDDNPIKYGFFVRRVGNLYEYTDGKGYFAKTPPDNLSFLAQQKAPEQDVQEDELAYESDVALQWIDKVFDSPDIPRSVIRTIRNALTQRPAAHDQDESELVKFAYLEGVLRTTNCPISQPDDIANMIVGMPKDTATDDRKVEWFDTHYNAIRNAVSKPAAPSCEVEYSQGICGDGAAILKDGIMMTIDEIVAELNALQAAQRQGGA